MVATAIQRKKDPLYKVFRWGEEVKITNMSKENFLLFVQENQDLQVERDKNGTVTIMPLVKGASGGREVNATGHVWLWQRQTRLGKVYGATNGFDLPDGSTKAPDTAWISDERLSLMTSEKEENSFIPIPPDFVIEVRSSSDRLPPCKNKMTDVWMKNGVRLAWLIDPYQEKVYIYRENGEQETVEGFSGKVLDGEQVLPGFELPLDEMKLLNR